MDTKEKCYLYSIGAEKIYQSYWSAVGNDNPRFPR